MKLRLTSAHRFRSRFGSDSEPRVRSLLPACDSLEGRLLLASDLVALSAPISPPAVEASAFTGVVAKFTDADKNTDPTMYAASIHWGDGTASQGTIAADPTSGFDVIGTHTFARSGSFRITAQVGDKDGDSATVSTTNIVAQAPITAASVAVRPGAGGVITGRTVATFTDADSALAASAFSATIHWGDGHSSNGTIVPMKGTGGFKVLGSHRYRSAGTFTIETSIEQGHGASSFYTVTNLISDGAVAADHINPNFVNPWGIVAPNPGDFWDVNNATGTSSVFDSSGNLSTGLPVVNIPAPAGSTGTAAPSGIVFAGGSGFNVTDGTHTGGSIFLFATEDGTISGWNPKVGAPASGPSTQAFLGVDNSASATVYKGLALVTVPAGNSLAAGKYLFATDFHNDSIDVFDSSFKPVTLAAGAFQDPTIPTGFAPFGIQSLNGNVYVTYAKQNDKKHDDVAGPGNGFVDVFSLSGAMIQRLGGSGVQTELNSPWAVTRAPSNFGTFSNDILIGDFGDSRINAFDPTTGAFLGQLEDAQGHAIQLDGGVAGSDGKGLWGLFGFGHGNPTGPSNSIFFTSGFNDEADGLFGSVTAASPASASTTGTVTIPGRGHRR